MSRSALRELQHLRALLDQPLGVTGLGGRAEPQKTAEALLQQAQVSCRQLMGASDRRCQAQRLSGGRKAFCKSPGPWRPRRMQRMQSI